jgi:hypothetical protein
VGKGAATVLSGAELSTAILDQREMSSEWSPKTTANISGAARKTSGIHLTVGNG